MHPDPFEELQSLLRFVHECPVGLVSFDDRGTVDRVNRAAATLLGAMGATPAPVNLFESLGETWPELPDLVRGTRAKGEIVADHRIACRDASAPAMWVAANVARLGDDRNLLTVTDVSKAVATEATLHESESSLQTVFDSIDEGFCVAEIVVDQHGHAFDLRFLKVNPLFAKVTGFVDAVGRTARELAPRVEQSWVDTYARVGLDRETLRFEQGPDGSGRWFDVFSAPLDPHGRLAIVFKDQTRRRRAEKALRVTAATEAFRSSLTDALRSASDPTEAHANAARLLGEFLGGVRVRYVEVDDPHGRRATPPELDLSPSILQDHIRPEQFASALLPDLRAGRTVAVADAAADERLTADEQRLTAERGVQAYVAVPVVHHDRTRATMLVDRPTAHRWTSDEISIIEEVAERASSAAERARNDEQLRVRHARAALVADVLAELERTSTVEAQAQQLAELLVPGFADYAVVEAPDRPDPVLGIAHCRPDALDVLRRLRRQHRIDPQDANSIARAANGEAQLLTGIGAATRAEYATDPEAAALLAELGPRAHIAVPLDLGGGERGALMVGLTEPDGRVLTAGDRDFLLDAAARVGVVLGVTRLRQQEHLVAARLQRALLPDRTRWCPAVVIAARYSAASAFMDVGGDWYDTFDWPDGRIGVMVGDVVGHNLESAVTMGRLRAATAAIAATADGSVSSPAGLLDALERFARSPDGTEFATAACVVVDPATGTLTYASAGHPPILVVAPDGTCRTLGDAQAPPLCAWASGPRPEGAIVLEPGSLVVLYSDGLVERRRRPLDEGFDHLRAACTALRDEPIDAVASRLVEEMVAFEPVEDDIVVACFRYAPGTAVFRRTIPADAGQLGPLRRSLRAWLDERGIAGERQQDVLLVVGEAVANAVEHGSGNDARRSVDVDVTDHDGHYVTVSVRDEGHWRHPRTDTVRGRGLGIMERLASHVTRHTGSTGTTVRLAVPVRAGRPAAVR